MVAEDFESRPHTAVSFVVERENEIQEWNEQNVPKVLLGYRERRLPGRNTKEAVKKKERKSPTQWLKASKGRHARMKMPSRLHEVGQSVKQNWDCSQIEHEEEEEEEDWQKENQMEVQWAEDEKLEESLDRKREGRKLFESGRQAKDTRVSGT